MCLGASAFFVMSDLSGHCSRDWSEYANVIGVIRETFACEFR